MWCSTSKGRTVREPSADQILGALAAAAPEEAVVLVRDLQRFVCATRTSQGSFAIAVRDGSLARQVAIGTSDVRDAAAALLAFATDASFASRLVDRAR